MDAEKGRLVRALIFPTLFIFLIWAVKIAEIWSGISFASFGLRPLQWSGIWGILTFPLIHAGWSHLFANTVPLLILLTFLFHSYREIAWKVFLLIYLVSGLWIWVFARSGTVHIGASGLIYGLAAFLFVSGILRRNSALMAITLLVVFLYGGLIWGIFPQFFPRERISWEGHLMGLLAGTILAFYFRKEGPQRESYQWGEEGDEDEDESGFPESGQSNER